MPNEDGTLSPLISLTRIFLKMADAPDLKQVIKEMVECTLPIFHADSGSLVLWESDLGVVFCNINIPSEHMLPGIIIKPVNGGLDGLIFTDKKIHYLSSYSKNADALPQLKGSPIQFGFGCPIQTRDRVIATLCWYYNERRERPKPIEQDYIAQIIPLFGIILDRLHLDYNFEKLLADHRQLREMNDLIFNTSPNIIIHCDISAKILFWNTAAERTTDFMTGEMLRQKLIPFFTDETRFSEIFLNCVNRMPSLNEMLFLKRKSGDPRLINLSFIPLQSDGNVESILLIGQDITEKQYLIKQLNDSHNELSQKTTELSSTKDNLQKIQDELIIAEKTSLIGQLSEKLAHHINNPLMTILNQLQFISDEVDKGAKPEVIAKITSETTFEIERIKRTLQSLKLVSDATKIDQYRPTELVEVINQTVAEYKEMMVEEAIKFTKSLDLGSTKSLKIRGNFLLLKWVLRILFQNAAFALRSPDRDEQEKKLLLSLSVNSSPSTPSNRTLVLSFIDNGCGMTEEELHTLFRPFYVGWSPSLSLDQDHAPNSKLPSIHIGLGLFILHIILQNHRAKIEIKSKPKKGTQIFLKFELDRGN